MNALDRLSEMLMRTGEEKLKKANEIKTDWMANLQLSDKQFGLNMLEKQLSQQSKDKRMFGTAKYQQSVLDSDRLYNIARTNQYKEDLMKTNYATAKKEGYRGTYEDFVENESSKALFGWNQAAADQATRRQYAQLGIDAGGNVGLGSGSYGYAGAARSGNPLDVIGGAVGSYSVDDYGNLDNPFDNTRINTQVDQSGRTWARSERFGVEEALAELEGKLTEGGFERNFISYDQEIAAAKELIPEDMQSMTLDLINTLENLTVWDSAVSDVEFRNRVNNAGAELAAYKEMLEKRVGPEAASKFVDLIRNKLYTALNARARNLVTLQQADAAGVSLGNILDSQYSSFDKGEYRTTDKYNQTNYLQLAENFANYQGEEWINEPMLAAGPLASLPGAADTELGGTSGWSSKSTEEKARYFAPDKTITKEGFEYLAGEMNKGELPKFAKWAVDKNLAEKAKELTEGNYVLFGKEENDRARAHIGREYLRLYERYRRGKLGAEDVKQLMSLGYQVQNIKKLGGAQRRVEDAIKVAKNIKSFFESPSDFFSSTGVDMKSGKIKNLLGLEEFQKLRDSSVPVEEKTLILDRIERQYRQAVENNPDMTRAQKDTVLNQLEKALGEEFVATLRFSN